MQERSGCIFMDVTIINNSKKETGLGKYAFELSKRLSKAEIGYIFLDYDNGLIREVNSNTVSNVRRFPLEHRYLWYLRAQPGIPSHDVYHLSNQNISFLKVNPKIVTCHDIFHVTHPRNFVHKMVGSLVYSGLKNAVRIITCSEYTKSEIVKYYGIPQDNISVVYSGVDNRFFEVRGIESVRTKYNLPSGVEYISHVSNEQPRKNFDKVLLALAKLKKKYDFERVALIKVGKPQYESDAKRNRALLRRLGLEKDVFMIENIPEHELPLLYRLSKVFVFPSSREGFGLPPLEAMACGIPVITAQVSSLPEVVGDAGYMVDPDNTDDIAKALYDVLTNEGLRGDMIRKGLRRAKMFSWEKTAQKTLQVYEDVYEKL
jgi:glycosyltransferase involved in cell wall biosynthesis